MKQFLRLYLKELKFLAGMGFIIFLINLALFINGYFPRGDAITIRVYLNDFISDGEPFYYCFMLVFSFFMENRSKTGYQIVSLPIRRFYIISSKFFAVLSIGFMLYFIQIAFFVVFLRVNVPENNINWLLNLMRLKGGYAYLSELKDALHFIAFSEIPRLAISQWIFNITFYPSLALVSLVASEIVQKHKVPVWVGIFLSLIAFDTFVIGKCVTVLHNWSIGSQARGLFLESGIHILFALVFVVAAFVVYNKFKEV